MKIKRRCSVALLLALFLTFTPVCAFADEIETVPITITSGLDLDSESILATFDESRIVYGEALPETKITVVVSRIVSGGMEETYSDELEVGSLGIFCITIPFHMGVNHISVSAVKDGYQESVHEVTVKKMPQSLKQELQRMVALPATIK